MNKLVLILVALTLSVCLKAQDEDDVFNVGVVQYTLQDYIGCIETMEGLIKKNPKNGEAWHYKALSKFFLCDYRGAQDDMKVAVSLGQKYKNEAFKIFLNENYKRKLIIKQFYKKTKLYPELGYRPKYTLKDSLRGSLRFERNCFDVYFYDLDLKINPKKNFISGSNTVYFDVVKDTKRIQIDLFSRYDISDITWNNQSLKYNRVFDAIFIDFPEMLPRGTKQSVKISYSGKPQIAKNPPWEGGFVWKKDKKGNIWGGVACEHLGASSWWPNKDHPTDEPDSMQLSFTIPTGYDLVSNGTLRKKEVIDPAYSKHTWFVANPINNYDATFYIGKYVHFSDTIQNAHSKYPLDFYVLPGNLEKAKKTFAQTKPLLEYYEKAFGEFPFPQDGFGLVESPYEGMEHQGAIAYGNEYDKMRRPEFGNRTDDFIIVHESAHEWWGNSVTAPDMAEIWLQEGFATYAELMFLENKYGYTEYNKQLKSKLIYIFNIWPIIQNYGVNENSFASNDCYNKGAAILNNLRCTINDDSLFFSIIKEFAVDYARQIASTTNFIDIVNARTGKDYSAFFDKFLYDKELPVLTYTYKREGNNILFKYKWDNVKKGFVMPFSISTGKANNNLRIEATTEEQEMVLKNAKTIRFLTYLSDTEDFPKNGLTYYWTRCVNN